MGCGGSKKVEPRCDVPPEGQEHKFLVKKEGIRKRDFIVYDASSPDKAPWMRFNFDKATSLENNAGTIQLEMYQSEGKSLMMTAIMDGVSVKEVGGLDEFARRCMSKQDENDTSVKGFVSVGLQRTCVIKDPMGVETASLSGRMQGGCLVWYQQPENTEEEKRYHAKFKAKSFDFPSAAIGDQKVQVMPRMNESKSAGMSCDVPWSQTYKLEPNCFDAEYSSSSLGYDTLTVQTPASAKPLVALTAAFIMARWLHPNVVEEAAKKRAIDIFAARPPPAQDP